METYSRQLDQRREERRWPPTAHSWRRQKRHGQAWNFSKRNSLSSRRRRDGGDGTVVECIDHWLATAAQFALAVVMSTQMSPFQRRLFFSEGLLYAR